MSYSPNHNLEKSKYEMRDYAAAELYGRDAGNCELAYPSCDLSLRELITTGLSLVQGSLSGYSHIF